MHFCAPVLVELRVSIECDDEAGLVFAVSAWLTELWLVVHLISILRIGDCLFHFNRRRSELGTGSLALSSADHIPNAE